MLKVVIVYDINNVDRSVMCYATGGLVPRANSYTAQDQACCWFLGRRDHGEAGRRGLGPGRRLHSAIGPSVCEPICDLNVVLFGALKLPVSIERRFASRAKYLRMCTSFFTYIPDCPIVDAGMISSITLC